MSTGKKKNSGLWILLFGAFAFGAVGGMAVVKPVPIASSAALGPHGSIRIGFLYSANTAVGFGVWFLAISAFLFLIAWRVHRDGD